MDYATQYHIGYHPNTSTAETTAVTPTVRRVRSLDAKTKGRKRNPKGQTEVRTDSHVANGFLKASFLPKLEISNSVQACTESGKTERDFYSSLSQLAAHYGIEPMQTRQHGYPYNIGLALWDAREKLKQTGSNWDSLQLVQDSKKTFFISEERYRTGSTLYYIPVMPLFEMLHDPKRKRTAHLLVSVCSYLYHIADIPYYGQENSYLYWQYEMLKDWVEQDDQTDETECYKSELRQAEWIGERIEQKIFNRINLTVFEQRLKAFKPKDDFDRECWQFAYNALALYTDYPKASIFRNAPKADEAPYRESDDYEQETLLMDKYISFMASGKGWLYESLSESVNNEFNEYGSIEEPTILKRMDGSPITSNNLDFENRLLTLLDDICYLLSNYKTTRR
jgi:hypothetical protein